MRVSGGDATMKVKVRLFANLRDYVPEAKIGTTLEVDLREGALVKDLVDHYQLPAELVKIYRVLTTERLRPAVARAGATRAVPPGGG